MGREIEVSTHGANDAQPMAASEARGILRRGADFVNEVGSPGSFAFYLAGAAGDQIASIRLYESSYSGGGWFDDEQEVLEIRSGVIQILIATVVSGLGVGVR